MVCWKLDTTWSSVSKHSCLILYIACLLIPQPNTGYIINNDGQLVPFKVYKKGGSRMCFLHPMNCRGGFHKRHFDETAVVEDGSIYNLKEVYKRKLEKNNEVSLVGKRQSFDQSIDDVYGDKENPTLHKYSNLLDVQENLEKMEQQRAASHVEGNVNGNKGMDKKVFFDKVSPSDDSSSEELTEDEIIYDQLFSGSVADPPPVDQPIVRAELVEYPAYEVLRLQNAMNPRKRQYIATPTDLGSYVFEKHRRR